MKLLLITIAALVLVGCGESKNVSSDYLDQPAKVDDMMPPLNIGAMKGDLEAVKRLIDAKASIDSDHYYGTPLKLACANGHIKIAELLIEKGADVNAEGNEGGTPLYIVADAGHKEIAKLLIANGADVNAEDEFGETPLHRAAREGHKEIAELLIAKGANVNANRRGGTPLDLAIEYRCPDTADLLRKHGGKTAEEFAWKAEGK